MPPLSEEEIAHFAAQLQRPLPDDIKELLNYSAGLDCQLHLTRTRVGTGRITGTDKFGFDALPCSVDLLGDGYGNFWVVDVNSTSGKWGVVLFVCHDPPAIAVQATDLGQFLLQLLDPAGST